MHTSRKPKVESRKAICLLTVLAFLLVSIPAEAQCAMCRAALESEGDVSKAEAVNDGIVYLMAIPYLLVAAVGYYVYKLKFSNKG
jgi:hypothetical protein